MFRLALAAVLLGVALGFRAELDTEWELFKETYNKQYTAKQEKYRRIIFEKNVNYIQTHNLEADRGEHSYRLGVNEYTDMSHKEFITMMNGYRMELKKPSHRVYKNYSVSALPTHVDWRPKGYVTPVKNQEQCGSCWAFSATGSLEGQHFKKAGKLVSLSEQNLVDCSKKEGNMGCEGGLMNQAFKYIKVNKGIDTEASYPYKARNGKCHFKRADVGATDTGAVDIKEDSEESLQHAVAQVGPIAVAIDASHPSFQLYKSGVYDEKKCNSKMLDHGVLAVGYGAEGSKDYWLVKNSWGETWGMKGYIMMSRNKKNQCGIATQASYPTV
ncbi:procathepsin L-like [Haliotis rufescens]|uniref:procathepsin L-like n=1 Tax=Haliotis rufescens TaxID=6454 RepID=UPI00201EA1D8|nr:procathepsin L-like [Haliotis rufescens]